MTNQELNKLTEYQDYDLQTLSTGETVRVKKPVKFQLAPTRPSDTVLFSDKNGVKWRVVYRDGKPYKERVRS